MTISSFSPLDIAFVWALTNFLIYIVVFAVSLYINCNFNTIVVGTIYLLPLVPAGLTVLNAERFLMVSFQNTVFGIIEMVVFVITVRSSDTAPSKDFVKQLLGHTLPIAAALIGLSFVSRSVGIPFGRVEFIGILFLFLSGAVLRVLAVCQLGTKGFKFDIVFREEQVLKTDQLYGWMRHPSYTAMMLVILAYAWNTHSWLAASLGVLLAWCGFQYRIHHEEMALARQFGEDYLRYKKRTGMWLPFP